jgi:hypothetical protein
MFMKQDVITYDKTDSSHHVSLMSVPGGFALVLIPFVTRLNALAGR